MITKGDASLSSCTQIHIFSKTCLPRPLHFSHNPINTNILPATVFAPRPHPHLIELVYGCLYKLRIVGEYARFKVPPILTLHTHSRARKIS